MDSRDGREIGEPFAGCLRAANLQTSTAPVASLAHDKTERGGVGQRRLGRGHVVLHRFAEPREIGGRAFRHLGERRSNLANRLVPVREDERPLIRFRVTGLEQWDVRGDCTRHLELGRRSLRAEFRGAGSL